MNAYHVLGIDPDSDDEAVRAAYMRQAKALHPDHNKRPTATKEFESVNKAYETLKDMESRRKHDYALMRVVAKDVPGDTMDDVLSEYGMDKPKKKKKKKKKKASEEFAQDAQFIPPYAPPQQHQCYEGRGNADYDRIPDGFDQDQSCGGIL